MIEVDAEPDAKGVTVPGGIALHTPRLPAPWGAMKERLRETRDRARIRYGREPHRVWIWYLTCRACSVERDFETLFVAHYRGGPAVTSDPRLGYDRGAMRRFDDTPGTRHPFAGERAQAPRPGNARLALRRPRGV